MPDERIALRFVSIGTSLAGRPDPPPRFRLIDFPPPAAPRRSRETSLLHDRSNLRYSTYTHPGTLSTKRSSSTLVVGASTLDSWVTRPPHRPCFPRWETRY